MLAFYISEVDPLVYKIFCNAEITVPLKNLACHISEAGSSVNKIFFNTKITTPLKNQISVQQKLAFHISEAGPSAFWLIRKFVVEFEFKCIV
jgi:hypothetical protein